MRSRFGLCVVAIVVFLSTGLIVARADEKPKTESAGNISLIVENDLVVRTDRDYTSGVKASWITAPENTPLWAKAFATQIPLFSNWSTVRTEYALQQVIFTPQRTTLATPDPRDRPYAGWLNASFALLGENGPLLDQLAVSVGVVGPASLAQESQKLIHDLYRQPSPNGWAYQLRNEPTLQLRYQRSWRALAAYSFDGDYGLDVTPHAGFMLGNVYTFANAGITSRISARRASAPTCQARAISCRARHSAGTCSPDSKRARWRATSFSTAAPSRRARMSRNARSSATCRQALR